MKSTHILALIAITVIVTSCKTIAPSELVNARSAHLRASTGPAAQLAPAELHTANLALAAAEKSFVEDKDSWKTKDLSYIAHRKADLADATAYGAKEKANKLKADADYQLKQTEMVKQGKQDVSDAEKLTATALVAIEQGKRDLSDADKRTAEADKRAADALAELAKLAAVKEEERGLVVTLSGSVLFTSAQATLLSSARVKLDQVATALLAVKGRNLIVEGHTDSQGSEEYNQGLSQRRADAVRDYLVMQGYPSDHIQARGMSEGSPVADNANAEGRANNRRVEIVIQRDTRVASR